MHIDTGGVVVYSDVVRAVAEHVDSAVIKDVGQVHRTVAVDNVEGEVSQRLLIQRLELFQEVHVAACVDQDDRLDVPRCCLWLDNACTSSIRDCARQHKRGSLRQNTATRCHPPKFF